jgi:hypothetical protein
MTNEAKPDPQSTVAEGVGKGGKIGAAVDAVTGIAAISVGVVVGAAEGNPEGASVAGLRAR